MKTLTPRQEKFAAAIVQGKSQSDAYREVYPKSREWKPEALHNRAYELAKNSEILVRIEKLKTNIIESSRWDRQQAVDSLVHILHTAARDGDKIKAIKELNSMHGYNEPEKINSNDSIGPSSDEVGAAVLEAIKRKYNTE